MGVQDFTSRVASLRRTGRREDANAYDAFAQIKSILDKLTERVDVLEAFQNEIVNQLAGASVYVKHFYLQADLTVPHPDEPPGAVILYVFLQDSTGGWVVTFPDTFRGLYADQIDTTADTLSSIVMLKTYANQLDPVLFGASGVITS